MKKFVSILLTFVMITTVTSCANTTQSDWQEHLDLGQKYLLDGDYEQAIIEFNKVIEIEPKNVDAYLGLAEAYVAAGDYDSAISVLEQGYAETENPALQDKISNMNATTAQSEDQSDDAAEVYDYWYDHYDLGESYLSSGDYENAEIEFRKAYEMYPDYYATNVRLIEVYAQLDNIEKVKEICERWIEIDPDEIIPRIIRVDYNRCMSKKEDFISALNQLVGYISYLSPLAELVKNDEVAEDFSWYIDNDTLYISGHGAMPTFEEKPWGRNRWDIKNVVFLEGITSIQNVWQMNLMNLEKIIIPSSVKILWGDDISANEIEISDGGAEIIWLNSFESAINRLKIPASTSYIEGTAFQNVTEINEIYVDENNPYYCSVENVLFTKDMSKVIRCSTSIQGEYIVPDSVITIDSEAFQHCKNITSIVLPDGLRDIKLAAFQGCEVLQSINIPPTITRIDGAAFSGCLSLSTVTIPSSVTDLDYDIFANTPGICDIIVDNNNSQYCSIDGVLFMKDMRELISFPQNKNVEQYIVPDGVTIIGTRAFNHCGNLINVTLSNGVEKIDSSAFYDCSSLTSITIPDSVTSIDESSFGDCDSLTIHAHAGSYAEQYANENGIPFVAE